MFYLSKVRHCVHLTPRPGRRGDDPNLSLGVPQSCLRLVSRFEDEGAEGDLRVFSE